MIRPTGNMVSNKVIAVAVVVIIAIAAVAAYVLLQDNDDDDNGLKDITGRLQVYGNANNDDFIDDSDLKAFDTLRNGTWDKEKYPFADANRNGQLDDEDREIIQKIINKEKVTISYINGLDEVKTLSYPIDMVGLTGTMIYSIPEILNVVDRVAARSNSSSMDEVLLKEIIPLDSLGAKAYLVDPGLLAKHPRIDAVITMSTSVYDDVPTVVENAQKACIRLDTESSEGTIQGYLLIGFLLDASEKASQYAQFYDSTMADIEKKLASVTEKKKTLTSYSYNICGKNYYLTQNTIDAGGDNLTTFTKNTQKIKDNPEYLQDYPTVQFQFQIDSMGWSTLSQSDINDEYDYYGKYFKYSAAYPDHYYKINKDMPDLIRTAFMASIMYPDVFGDDYGYKTFQSLLDQFYQFLGTFDVTKTGTWYITSSMVTSTA